MPYPCYTIKINPGATVSIDDLAEWCPPVPKATKPPGWATDALANIKEGERNSTLHRLACRYIAKGIPPEEIEILLRAKAHEVGIEDKEFNTLFASALGFAVPLEGAEHAEPGPEHDHYTVNNEQPGGSTEQPSGSTEYKHAPLDVSKIVCPNSFYGRYLDYAGKLTDAPDIFHLFCAMTAVSGAVGNKVTFAHFGSWLPCNLWVLLVAPSTVVRKSTAIKLAMDLLHAATKHTVFKPDPNFKGHKMRETDHEIPVERSALFPDEMSMESLIEYLKDQPGGVLARDEWSAFVSQCDRSYMAGALELLTKLYDGQRYVKVLRRGEVSIDGHSISVLAGSTPEWIERQMDPIDFVGGFYPRFILVPMMTRTRSAGLPKSADKVEKEAMIKELKSLSETPVTELEIDQISDRFFTLQEDLIQSSTVAPHPGMAAAVAGRLAVTAIKMAILLEIGTSGRPVLNQSTFAKAADLAEWLFNEFNATVGEDVATSGKQFERDCQRAMKVLDAHGGRCPRSTITRTLRGLTPRDLDQIQQGLVDAARIVVHTENTKGRPKVGWAKIA